MHLLLAHHLKVANVTVDAAIIVLLDFRDFILVLFASLGHPDSAFVHGNCNSNKDVDSQGPSVRKNRPPIPRRRWRWRWRRIVYSWSSLSHLHLWLNTPYFSALLRAEQHWSSQHSAGQLPTAASIFLNTCSFVALFYVIASFRRACH